METPPPAPQLSPDGKWWWDGQHWVPASQATMPAGPPPPAPVTGLHKPIRPYVLVAALIALLVVGALVYQGTRQENRDQHQVDCSVADLKGETPPAGC